MQKQNNCLFNFIINVSLFLMLLFLVCNDRECGIFPNQDDVVSCTSDSDAAFSDDCSNQDDTGDIHSTLFRRYSSFVARSGCRNKLMTLFFVTPFILSLYENLSFSILKYFPQCNLYKYNIYKTSGRRAPPTAIEV